MKTILVINRPQIEAYWTLILYSEETLRELLQRKIKMIYLK